MGHAGAIVRGAAGAVDGKQKELRAAGWKSSRVQFMWLIGQEEQSEIIIYR